MPSKTVTSSGSASNNKFNKRKFSGGAAAKAASASGSAKHHSHMRKPVKDETESIATEVIDEESFQHSEKNDNDDDSIKEESHIADEFDSYSTPNEQKKSSESIAEDSIIREEYS